MDTPGFHPLYAQVRDLLVRRIADGAWKPGEALPPEPALARAFKVSQGTVRKALDELTQRDVLVRRQGKGTYVAEHTAQRALFRFFHLVADDGARALPAHRLLDVREAAADPREAARLAVRRGQRVVRVHRLRPLGGQTVIVERITLPAARFPGFAKLALAEIPNELYRFYEIRFGVTVAHATERLKAVAAGAAEAKALGLAPGAPLLEIDRVARDLDGKPVEWRRSRCSTARHHYLSELD